MTSRKNIDQRQVTSDGLLPHPYSSPLPQAQKPRTPKTGVRATRLSSAGNYSSSEQAIYPNLPGLAGVQLENEALVYYGGFASGTHYYSPNSTGTAWVATTNTNVTTYVKTVRGDIQ